MQLIDCVNCGKPTKVNPYKLGPARLIKCKKCKQFFNPFSESPKFDEPEFVDLKKLKK